MKNTIHKYKILYVLFFVLSLNFFSTAKGADTFNYSAFMPTSPVNATSYYNPNDFKGQPFPALADDAPCVDLNYDLKIGSRDYSVYGSVTKLQMFLYSNEYMIYPPTGLFKYYTYNGVRNFQRDNGLKETGIVDRNTRTILKKISCSNQDIGITPIQTSTPAITPIITPVITPIITPGNTSADTSEETPLNNNYTIEYSPNGADSGSPSTYSQSVIQGGTLTTAMRGTMVRNGYTFTGWSTSPTGSDLIQAGSSYTPVTDLTLYAIWVNENRANTDNGPNYTIIYSANGADSGEPNVTYQDVMVGRSVTLASQNTLSKYGYTFAGWSLSQNGTNPMPAETIYTPDGNITLYATWISQNKNNNLITISNTQDSYGSFYINSSFPVASSIMVNYSYDYCIVKTSSCSPRTGQTYITTGATQSDSLISTNNYSVSLKNPKIISVSPSFDSSYYYNY